jgi:hypothetical protein
MAEASAQPEAPPERLTDRHLRAGWWSLFVFMTAGLALELLHGFKLGFYLDVDNETRRLMWRLAHAHGALLGLVHIAFAATRSMRGAFAGEELASRALLAATVLLPGGFALGGIWIHSGDPGLGVLLVPPGALLLLAAVAITASGSVRR